MFYTEIAWLAQRRITTGYPDGSFRPAENTSRAAIGGVLSTAWRVRRSSPRRARPRSRMWLPATSSTRRLSGCGAAADDGVCGWHLRPQDAVNRDAMAAFFYRYAGSPAFTAPDKPTFKDVAPNSMFYREIEWLAAQKVTTGWPDQTYRPLEPIHRDAMAAFLYRYNQGVLKAAG